MFSSFVIPKYTPAHKLKYLLLMLFICLNSTFCGVVQNLVFKIEVRLYHSCELDPGQNLDSIAVSVFVFIFVELDKH